MTVTEEDRYHLHQQLDEAVGEKGANTAMELLPPVGWAEVATNRDLDQLGERLEGRIERVELRIRADFEKSLRQLQTDMLSAIVAAVAFISALSVFGPH